MGVAITALPGALKEALKQQADCGYRPNMHSSFIQAPCPSLLDGVCKFVELPARGGWIRKIDQVVWESMVQQPDL